jgi:hypothetical protein
MVMDQILDPSDFPWQSSESQMVAFEMKLQIKTVLENLHQGQVGMVKGMIPPSYHHPPPPEPEPEPEQDEG